MRIGASKLHGPPHTATAPGTSLLLSQQLLPVAHGRPPCCCFCRWPCSPIVRVLLHMPRGCAPRAAPALLHAGRCALRALPPSALRTAHAIEPSAVRSAPVAPPPPHAAAPLPPHAAPPRRPCERCRSYHATARARDYILVAGGNRWTEGLVGGVDGLGRLVGGY